MSRSRRGGFTLLEVLIVLVITSIFARIGIPAYHNMLLRGRAVAVLGDIQVVRVAALSYHFDTSGWPEDASRGVTPPELIPYLPAGFDFYRGHYELDWENWMLPDGSPSQPGTTVLVGISLVTDEPVLGRALVALLGGQVAHYTIEDHYTFVILSD